MSAHDDYPTARGQIDLSQLSNYALNSSHSSLMLPFHFERLQLTPSDSVISLAPSTSGLSTSDGLSVDGWNTWQSLISANTDTPATSIHSPASSRLSVYSPEPPLQLTIQSSPASEPATLSRQDLDVDSLILALAPGTIPLAGGQREKIRHAYCIVVSSQWLQRHEPEPRDGCGRSIFLLFLAPTGAGALLKCMFHGCHGIFGRQDRALAHVRSHFDHRPFACRAACGDTSCVERFYSAAYLRSHLQRPKVACELCGKVVVKTTLRRHTHTCRKLSLSRA